MWFVSWKRKEPSKCLIFPISQTIHIFSAEKNAKSEENREKEPKKVKNIKALSKNSRKNRLNYPRYSVSLKNYQICILKIVDNTLPLASAKLQLDQAIEMMTTVSTENVSFMAKIELSYFFKQTKMLDKKNLSLVNTVLIESTTGC